MSGRWSVRLGYPAWWGVKRGCAVWDAGGQRLCTGLRPRPDRALVNWASTRFPIPGDGINGIMEGYGGARTGAVSPRRITMTRRGVMHLCMPHDIQIASADADPDAQPALPGGAAPS